MVTGTAQPPGVDDWAFQEKSLQLVSRTFALTIPQLPEPLRQVVSNAYLLCRIADTIEDDKHLPFADKRRFADEFIEVVGARRDAGIFAESLHPLLSPAATEAERELIAHTPAVIRITHSFTPRQRAALERCVRIMADGMARFQETNVRYGLKDLPEMGRGAGVKLQRYKDGGLSDAKVFDLEAGLSWTDSSNRQHSLSKGELRDWRGSRADAGRLAPKLPKNNRFRG